MQTRKSLLSTVLGAALGLSALAVSAATPVVWTTPIDPVNYGGSSGTISFNDWGYKGPRGVGANDYQVGPGFDAYRLGQIQHVESILPDWLTPDAPQTIWGDNLVTFTPVSLSTNITAGVSTAGYTLTTLLQVVVLV